MFSLLDFCIVMILFFLNNYDNNDKDMFKHRIIIKCEMFREKCQQQKVHELNVECEYFQYLQVCS